MHTWGYVIDSAPFAPLFPDGRVPLKSIWPIEPREAGAPMCYLVDIGSLSHEQIEAFAELLYKQWSGECESPVQAVAYIHEEGLPLRVSWFSGVATTRMGLLNLP